jgi:hypothetical protein
MFPASQNNPLRHSAALGAARVLRAFARGASGDNMAP